MCFLIFFYRNTYWLIASCFKNSKPIILSTIYQSKLFSWWWIWLIDWIFQKRKTNENTPTRKCLSNPFLKEQFKVKIRKKALLKYSLCEKDISWKNTTVVLKKSTFLVEYNLLFLLLFFFFFFRLSGIFQISYINKMQILSVTKCFWTW